MLRRAWATHQNQVLARKYASMSVEEAFTNTYKNGEWGASDDPALVFSSGSGTRNPAIVEPYIDAISGFLAGLGAPPNVVDIGCGDFSIGRRVRPFCAAYVACDIVRPLIEFNQQHYRDADVDFRALDASREPIPAADVVFIRQVLQHLANADVQGVLRNLDPATRYLVVTEHLPLGPFVANRDKHAGPHIRIKQNSGVVLTAAPFNLQPIESRELCRVEAEGGLIQTMVYRLR
jgi:hypothetical protein